MKISSAKAKGRRAAAGLREALLLSFPELEPDDILITPSSCTGEDLILSPAARKVLPFVFEVKNQERLNIWQALKQASGHGHSKKHLIPVLCFTKNRSDSYVTVKLSDFLALLPKPGILRKEAINA